MTIETRRTAAAMRSYMEKEIESVVRQMRIEGATLDDCEAELHLLAAFVRAQEPAARLSLTNGLPRAGAHSDTNGHGRLIGQSHSHGLKSRYFLAETFILGTTVLVVGGGEQHLCVPWSRW